MPAYGVAYGKMGRMELLRLSLLPETMHVKTKGQYTMGLGNTFWMKGLALTVNALPLINAGSAFNFRSARKTGVVCCQKQDSFAVRESGKKQNSPKSKGSM